MRRTRVIQKTGWDENREGLWEGRARRGKRTGKQKKEGAEKVVWKLIKKTQLVHLT